MLGGRSMVRRLSAGRRVRSSQRKRSTFDFSSSSGRSRSSSCTSCQTGAKLKRVPHKEGLAMESRERRLCFGSLIVGLLALLSFVTYELSLYVQNANAIPAFARKYGFSCNVCHVPGFPKLNDTGNIFRDQGYQLGGDGDLPTHEGITMGYFPLSFRTTVGYQAANVRTDGSGVSTGGFGFTGLDILSFGLLHRDI